MIRSYPTESSFWSRCFGYQVYIEAVDPLGAFQPFFWAGKDVTLLQVVVSNPWDMYAQRAGQDFLSDMFSTALTPPPRKQNPFVSLFCLIFTSFQVVVYSCWNFEYNSAYILSGWYLEIDLWLYASSLCQVQCLDSCRFSCFSKSKKQISGEMAMGVQFACHLWIFDTGETISLVRKSSLKIWQVFVPWWCPGFLPFFRACFKWLWSWSDESYLIEPGHRFLTNKNTSAFSNKNTWIFLEPTTTKRNGKVKNRLGSLFDSHGGS